MSVEFSNRSWSSDSAPTLFPGTLVSPFNHSIDLVREFNSENDAVMQRRSSTVSLAAATGRGSHESMDLDELKPLDLETPNQANASESLQELHKAEAFSSFPHQKDPDPCLGSAANHLPRQSMEAVHTLFLSNRPDNTPTDLLYDEPGTTERYSEREWSSVFLNSRDSWSSHGASAPGLPQPYGMGQVEMENQQYSYQLSPRQQSGEEDPTNLGRHGEFAAPGAQNLESATFYATHEQQQQQQFEMYPSGSVTNIACNFETLAPKMTRPPEIPCQLGMDNGIIEEAFASHEPNPTGHWTGFESIQILEMPPAQPPIAQQAANSMIPAPPIVKDDEDDILDSIISWESPSPDETPSPDTEAEAERKAQCVREIMCLRRGIKADALPKKQILIHEVVHIMLLCDHNGCPDLRKILRFCTEDGFESFQVTNNFMVHDTVLMGQVWKRLKGNTKGYYDTFARAMRTCRQQKKDYFDYLDSGKGSRKRMYKLGSRSIAEIEEISKVLRRFKPQ
ncbi:hypothetical protein BOX15_Mlig022407g2 [Macrostomum lignano]|uniref:Uncharacterized protein n=2 Tax=Macrostomum lignano TaxID=282301 RepID=A0A267DHZ8_9PLAT|nr:hypothetical protein BOX15_Mlig022407g2 [Macrostomum lignano]